MFAQTTLTESPDLGDYWNPLNPQNGTFVYANSFVAGASGDVTQLGVWLNTENQDPSTDVTLEILGQSSGIPQIGDVLAESNPITNISGGLTLYTPTMDWSDSLTAGDEYFIAASVIGAAGDATFQVGGHTEGTVAGDTGAFWYSNYPDGSVFDGVNRQPEMAFTVTIGGNAVPDAASSWLLLGLGLGMILIGRRVLSARPSA